MKKYILLVVILFIQESLLFAQYKSKLSAQQWTDSVFNSLSEDERIAQLMVIRAHSNLGPDQVAKVVSDIQKYNVGALCFFQGGPVRQANLTNYYQSIAKTPLMMTIDGEWGLGMRLDSVTKFPYQLTLGAMNDENLVYRMGLAVGEQCKRIGVQVNYAPVVDVNNNPNNPVIGYRSFGEDKYKVAAFGVAYMKGMQDAGIMACAKHFPGHGDVDVDSHLDLPVINKSRAQLDSMELIPFRAIFDAGVGSVMIAHLYIPAIDTTANKATSISKNNVTNLLRNDLGYKGLTFTDALEMKGVAKYFPGGTISVEALIAGNDMLCLPESVGESIEAIKKAIADKQLSWDDINAKVKKVLASKYKLGLNQWKPIELNNLLADLNAKTDAIRREVAQKTITVLSLAKNSASRTDYANFPLKKENLSAGQAGKIAYIGIGAKELNSFGKRLQDDLGADVFLFSYKDSTDKAEEILKAVPKDGKYDAIIIGIHDFSNRPANNYMISPAAIDLYKKLNFIKTQTFVFGNVLATQNFCDANTLVACYQDDNITQEVAADMLEGKLKATGTLPIRVCNFKQGDGIVYNNTERPSVAFNKLNEIDSIVNDAIAQKAFPGCVVLAVHKGEIIYDKAFGHYEYEPSPAVTFESIFDLASVTKVSATTVAVMKLYEQGKLSLTKKLGDYLPWVKGTDKANLEISEILLHQAGLTPFIPFYKETIDSATGIPNPAFYSNKQTPGYSIRVAENIYLRNDWNDTMFSRILKSPLGPQNKYVYSDNDFIFLGKIVEQLSGMPLNEYVQKTFYSPMGMQTTGFKPRNRFAVDMIVPTETEKHFRRQTTQGDVHDEGASMFGGVAGHAGLFSDAYDLSMLYQMLLNGGEFNGERYLKEETINYFTAYHSKVSRRGYGFDKPEKDNKIRKDPYPSALASPQTFGHTGFTGTCVWVDPKYDIVYIFLSNRVYPTRDNPKLSSLGVRGKIQDAIYKALGI
ncbi:MAG TPA: glycoside hydrolase family 3 N-terminal domain-containing protein [Chitinophagaceae bacterium]